MRSIAVALGCLLACAAIVSAQLGDCDPLDESRCGLPFPNNFWLRPNAQNQNRITFAPVTLPADRDGVQIDPIDGGWNELDGFPGLGAMMTYLGSVSLHNVPPYYNISRYAEPDCPIILLDTVTGKRTPVWAELDHSDDSKGNATDAYQRMFMMWPSARLVGGRRYIVALRNLVDQYTGAPVNTSYAFTCLRDGIPTHDPNIELRRALFADIFSRLTAAGVAQSSLQLAWDFTVASDASISDRMTFIRDDAFKRLATTGIDYKILSIQNNVSATTWSRFITVQLQIPQYLTSIWPGSWFVLDANGVPQYQGVTSVWCDIYIPWSVSSFTPGVVPSVLQYGHGLFGDRSEAGLDYMAAMANDYGYIVVASDWIGLSEEDVPSVAVMLATNFTQFKMVPDRCQQGMLHALVLMRFLSDAKWLADPAMSFPNPYNNGAMTPVLPAEHGQYYNGNSQGGILGTMYMAVSQDVTRGVSGVGGGPYSLLLPRSSDFTDLFDLLKFRYPNTLDRPLLLGAIQMLWDRADPGGYVHRITGELNANGAGGLLPNTPAHAIVWQHGLGDAQVTYVGVQTLGRSAAAVMYESNVNEPNEQYFGFPFIADSAVARVALEQTWQFATVPPVPEWNVPPNDGHDTHEGPRRQLNAQEQMFTFFTTGDIMNMCAGPCLAGPMADSDNLQQRAATPNAEPEDVVHISAFDSVHKLRKKLF